jgi:hypothetical protein
MTLLGQTDGMRLRRCGSRGGGEFWILDVFPRLRDTLTRGFLIEKRVLMSRGPGTHSRALTRGFLIICSWKLR